jgi:ATP-dependent DNA helicase RecG
MDGGVMNIQYVKNLLVQGEGTSVEFKECRTSINRSVYETVCAFLNRMGGEILLGVSDTGVVTGIDPDKIEPIKKYFVTSLNNSTKLSPTYLRQSLDNFEIMKQTNEVIETTQLLIFRF